MTAPTPPKTNWVAGDTVDEVEMNKIGANIVYQADKVSGVTITGTPTAGQSPVTTSPVAGNWQTPVLASSKNQPNGVAGLNSSGQVAAAQLPSYVDDVLEYANTTAFPATGESGKIYLAMDTGKSYRWTGTIYMEVVTAPGSTDSVAEGTTNLYYTQTRTDARIAAVAPELIRDTMGTTLVAGPNVTIDPNDAGDTITIGAPGAGGGGGGVSLTDDGTGLFGISSGAGVSLTDDGTGLFTVGAPTPPTGGSATALTPEQFGAIGDLVTNDTAAMQAWLTAVTAGNKTGLATAPVGYRITSELVISTGGARQWNIDFQGKKLLQATSGLSHIRFTAEDISFCTIKNMFFDYATQQTAAGKACVTFDCTTGIGYGWYANIFENITFSGLCYRGFMALETAGHVNPVWGNTFRNVGGLYAMTGSVIRLHCAIGCPNNLFEHPYQHRHACNEPTLDLNLQNGVTILNMETNESDIGGPDLYVGYSFGVKLTTVRSERGTNNSGDGVYVFEQCAAVDVSDWNIQARPFVLPGSVFKCTSSTSISVGPGTVSTYSPHADAGANLTIVSLDSTSKCTRYEGVFRPTAVLDGVSALTTGVVDYYGAKLSSLAAGGGSGGGGSSVPQIRKQSIMALGHSLMAIIPSYNTSTNVDTHLSVAGGHSPADFLTLANLQEGSPLDVLGSAATPGYSVEQIRDIHLPVILAAKPEYCFVWGPIANNLLGSGEFPASTLDVEKYIYDQLVAVGVTPIMASMPPFANSNNPGATQQEMIRYSAWASNYAQKKGFPFLDFYSALVDPATGSYRSGENYAPDSPPNLHPGPLAAARLVPLVRELIKKIANRPSPVSLPGYAPSITGRAANPLLAGTLGANLPTGWTSSGVTFSLAAGTYPVLGNVLTVTSTGSFGYVIVPQLAGTVGQEWDLAMRWATTPAAGGGWGMTIYDQGGTVQRHAWGDTSMVNPTQLSLAQPFHARGKFDSGVTSLGPLIWLQGAGSSMQIAQYGFVNASAQSVTLV